MLTIIQIILFLIIVILFIYHRLNSRYCFWEKLDIPYAKPTFFFGNIKNVILGRNHISEEFESIYRSFPRETHVGYFEFFRPHLMVKDPKLIEHILIKDFGVFNSHGIEIDERLNPIEAHLVTAAGSRWKMMRTKLQHGFSTSRIKLTTALVQQTVQDLDEYVSRFAEAERCIDVRETITKFTMDTVGRYVFGLEFDTLKNSDSQCKHIGKLLTSRSFFGIIKSLLRMIDPKILTYLKIKTTSKCIEQFFFDIFRLSVAYRKQQNVQRNDFMQLVINLYNVEILNRKNHLDRSSSFENKEPQFTENLLVSNLFIFYAAGFDTTVPTLSYLFYELALNLDVQEKLRTEINEVCGDHKDVVNYDMLKKMKYLEMIISETLRKYSPAAVLRRQAEKEYRIPGTQVKIPARTRISIPVCSIHHDPKYYPEPNKFIPERFTEENIAARPAHTFLPYGDGPRICIALKFVEFEIKACVAHIIRKYRFVVCDKTPLRIRPRPTIYFASQDINLSVLKL